MSEDKFNEEDKLSEETTVLKGEKARLNVTIDKKLADLAKAKGINISGTLERILIFRLGRDVSKFDEYRDTWLKLVKKYDEIINLNQQILILYNISVEIGEITGHSIEHERAIAEHKDNPEYQMLYDMSPSKIILHPHMISLLKGSENYILKRPDPKYSKSGLSPILIRYLYEPDVIYRNTLKKIESIVHENKEKVRKLELGLKIMNIVLANNNNNNHETDSSESGIGTPSLRRILNAGKTMVKPRREVIPA